MDANIATITGGLPVKIADPPASVPDAEEQLLIIAARQGDLAAFDSLVSLHFVRVSSIARQYLHSRQEVEDAVQDTFVKAYQSIHTFRGDSQFRTWIIRITINTCKNRRGSFWSRFVSTGDEAPLLLSVDNSMNTERSVLDQARSTELLRAVRSLPEKQREPIVLHFFEELSGAEIAAILGCNESTVWSRIYTGLKTLRKRLHYADELLR